MAQPNNFAERLAVVLQNDQKSITTYSVAERIRERSVTAMDDPPLSVPMSGEGSNIFLGAATIDTPPTETLERPGKKRMVHATVAISGLSAFGSAAAGILYLRTENKVLQHPDSFESREEYEDAVRRGDNLRRTSLALGGLAVAGGAVAIAVEF